MQLRKASFKNDSKTFKSYLNKNLKELQNIEPLWACGSDADKILNKILHPSNNRYSFFSIQTKELVEKSIFGEFDMIKFFTGDRINDTRIARILFQWDNKQYLDPPSIYLHTPTHKGICFEDGRHRTKVCYFLGIKQFPVAVDNSDVNTIREFIKLSPLY